MINMAIGKIQAEIDNSKNQMEKMLGQQIIDNITSNDRAGRILAEDKTLAGCKKAFDDFASKHKQGNQSVIGPEQAEELIFKYFGFGDERNEKNFEGIVNILDFM